MPNHPSNEQSALGEAAGICRVKCYLEPGHTFVGWLNTYSSHGVYDWVGYEGSEDTPAGVRVAWYRDPSDPDRIPYLKNCDSSSTRYLGPNEADDHVSAEWNLWASAAGILYNKNGDRRFRLWNNQNRYCYAAGSNYVYWGDYGEALQFEFVPA